MKTVLLSLCAACAVIALPAHAQDDAETSKPAPPEAKDALHSLPMLIGKWRPVENGLPASMKEWQQQNGISDSWVEYQWGTDRRWIDFGDWRVVPEGERKQGAGIAAYDHGRHVIAFREHGARETIVDGTLTLTDERTVVRDIAIITPTGGWRQVDTFTFDADNWDCYTWSTVRYRGGRSAESEPYRLCRAE